MQWHMIMLEDMSIYLGIICLNGGVGNAVTTASRFYLDKGVINRSVLGMYNMHVEIFVREVLSVC